MEKLVTSLENSKKLKELGVKQTSEFYWSFNQCCEDVILLYQPSFVFPTHISAFTATELMEILPPILKGSDERWYHLQLWTSAKSEYADGHIEPWNAFIADYYDCGSSGRTLYIDDRPLEGTESTPQDALAALYIYCIENKLIEI